MWLLVRRRLEWKVAHAGVLALERRSRRSRGGPQLLDQSDDLALLLDSLIVVVDPGKVVSQVFRLEPTGSDGDDDTAVGELVHRRQRLGQQRRVAEAGVQRAPSHAGAPSDRSDGNSE